MIRGRVQGVGFRWFAVRAASEIQVRGFVQNMPDGSVLCEAEGDPESLDAFEARLRLGPRSGRVDQVERCDLEPTGARDFEIR